MSNITAEPLFISDDLALLDHGIIISMSGENGGSAINPNTPKANAPAPKEDAAASDGVAKWGEDNGYPQDIIERAKQDLELLPLLDKKARLLQGREVVAINMAWNEEKKDFDVQRVNDDEINNFLFNRRTQRYWRESCVDFTWFHNFFADLIRDKAQEKFVYLGIHAAENSRWSTQNDKGVIEFCYVSPHWPGADIADKTKVMRHRVLDPYSYSVVQDLKSQTGEEYNRVVWPSSFPTPGQNYYQNAPWHAYLFSDWAKIKANIPKWKVRDMERILSAKYIATFSENYWTSTYKDWNSLGAERRLEIKKETIKQINANLTGFEGASATILTDMALDRDGKPLPNLTITPIEGSKNTTGTIEDSQEASEYMMRSLDLDPTIVGKGPGRGKDAGSGSDKRVAFNILVALLQPYRDVILEPLYFIAEYNGWLAKYPNLRFKVLEVELETLDKSHKTAVVKNPVNTKENVN